MQEIVDFYEKQMEILRSIISADLHENKVNPK